MSATERSTASFTSTFENVSPDCRLPRSGHGTAGSRRATRCVHSCTTLPGSSAADRRIGKARPRARSSMRSSRSCTISHQPRPFRSRPEHPALERAMEYLRRIWQDGYRSCSLAELASGACSSPTHLSRLFRAELRRQPRIGPSRTTPATRRHSLDETSLSMQAISAIVGFATQFHFSDTFRRHFRLSPTDYRKRAVAGHSLPTLLLGRLRTFHPDLVFVG